ncbi:MAG: efflux RND transporter periplasmic adaptor subunit [Nitrospirae bacterium]|nr:efflux RND transporter periplasmic adaptor subunit [Nitrospirota bacterium]
MIRSVQLLAIILVASLIYACNEKIKPGEQEVKRPLVQGIVIEEVKQSEVTDLYETSGTLRSRNTALVSAQIMGEVKEINVKPGDRVKKDDVLLVIKAPDIGARVQAAQEAFEEAQKGLSMAGENRDLMEKTFERYKKLFDEKAISGQEFDEIKTKKDVAALEYERSQKALKRAEAGLNEAEAFKGYAVIRSPLNGIVSEKKIDAGSMTAPGAPLFIIEEPVYRVEVPVDEGQLSYINTGTPVDIVIDAIGVQTGGRVGEVVRQIDPLTRTFTVKVDISESAKPLQGGFYARAKFTLGKKSGLFIPEVAIVSRGELKAVYAVDQDGIITFRLVKTGKSADGMTEILSGLNAGERIIVKGSSPLAGIHLCIYWIPAQQTTGMTSEVEFIRRF